MYDGGENWLAGIIVGILGLALLLVLYPNWGLSSNEVPEADHRNGMWVENRSGSVPEEGEGLSESYELLLVDPLPNHVVNVPGMPGCVDDGLDFGFAYIDDTRLHFTLRNRTDHVVSVVWDAFSIGLFPGNVVSNVMHAEQSFSDRNKPARDTSVAPGEWLSTFLVPVSRLYYSGGWHIASWLLPELPVSLLCAVRSDERVQYYRFLFEIRVECSGETHTLIQSEWGMCPLRYQDEQSKGSSVPTGW